MARFGDLDTQYFDASGDPLVNGKIYFYESGTTTPKTTFADINSEIPNTNPVLLDASGRQPNIFFEGVAKAILTNNTDVQIVSRDPVGETATNFGDEWVSTRIYGTNDVVIGSDGQYYRSLLTGNQNNNPVTTSGYWSLLYSVEWNAGINYDVGATVTYDTLQYQSLQTGNLNHAPDASPTWWVPLEFVWTATSTYELNQNVVGTDGILYTSLQASNINHDPATSPAWWVGTSAAAAASATAAAASATAALASEVAAQTAETGAQTAQTAAELAETNAETAQAAAEAAQAAAELAETNAETAETNAAASATASATSASDSATSATASATSATASAASATAAATSETNAATSETNAATSATNAATSETNAANSATAAATSATDSANSATASASSATAAAGSATAASGSATAAATSATNAATSETNAATAEAGAEAALDEFTDIYLGAFASDPTTDNDGDPLAAGMLYYNTSADVLRVYSGTAWQDAGSAVNGTSNRATYTATSGQTTFAIVYDVGYVDVYLNGVKLIAGTDYTATNGTSIVLTTGATLNDLVDIIAFGTFSVANALTISDLGVSVQAYDADTTKNDVANTFTQKQTFTAGADISTNQFLKWNNYNLMGLTTGLVLQIGNSGNILNTGIEFYPGGVVAGANKMTLGTTGSLTVSGQYIEEYNATGTSGAVTIDLDAGNNFSTAMAGAVTYTFSNVATSGKVSSFTLKVVNDGNAITWPASVDWPAATAPTLSASGATDVFVFYTHDGGTTWYGFTAGQAMA